MFSKRLLVQPARSADGRDGRDGRQQFWGIIGAGEAVNKSAARAASLDYVKCLAVIKSAASAASMRGGGASGRLDHDSFLRIFWPR